MPTSAEAKARALSLQIALRKEAAKVQNTTLRKNITALSNETTKQMGFIVIAAAWPPMPTGLNVTDVTASAILLEWIAATDATSWTVYVNGIPLSPTTTAAQWITGLAPSTVYSFQVQAHNLTSSSVLSAIFFRITNRNTNPEWVFPDQTVEAGQAISIPLNTVSEDFDGHVLTYSIVSGSVAGLTLSNGVWAGTPTTPGTFPVVFRANDGYTTVDESVTFTITSPADTTAPSIPGSPLATVNGSTVSFNWNLSTDASNIYAYQVRRDGTLIASLVGGRAFVDGVLGAVAGPPFIQNNVPNNTYTYAVRAIDDSPAQNASLDATAPPVVVSVLSPIPDVPIYAPITVISSSQLNHSWTAGGSGVAPTEYQLDRSLTGTDAQNPVAAGWTNVFTDNTVPLSVTFNNTGLTASTAYFYRLRAFNGATPSAGYATRNATTSPATGIVWPGVTLSGGPPWHAGIGSANSKLSDYEGLVGHGMDCYAEWTGESFLDTWSDWAIGGSGKFDTALSVIPDNRVIIHVYGMCPQSEATNNNRFEQIASGTWDSSINTGFANMKTKCQNAGRALNTIILDLGHEMTGTWYPWSMIDGTTKIQAYKDAFEHIVDRFRVYFPTSLVCIRPARRRGGTSRSITLAQLLPASTHYDIISRSLHDAYPHVNRNDPNSWNRHVSSSLASADGNIGLQDVANECRARGKKMGFSEWGTPIESDGGTGHQPNIFGPTNGTAYWFEKVYEFMLANQDIMLYDTCFMPSRSRLWGTRTNTLDDPQLSERHEAGKAAYNANTRWGKD